MADTRIIKNSDFIGRFKIANSLDNSPNSDLIGNNEELSIAINEFEPECLVTVLGYSLTEELLPELDKKPFNSQSPDQADQKWIDLVNGKDNWQGLKQVLVPYIYYYFMLDDESSHTGVGVVKENPKGATSFQGRSKAVNAWRAFYEAASGKRAFDQVLVKQSYVGSIVGVVYSDEDDKYWSLYKFLQENADIYDSNPSVLNNLTYYGI